MALMMLVIAYNNIYIMCNYLKIVIVIIKVRTVRVIGMRVRIKKDYFLGASRIDSFTEIKEVEINEDLMNPKKETIAVCFRGNNSSGIINFSAAEIDKLYNSVKGRLDLIKGFKKIKIKR